MDILIYLSSAQFYHSVVFFCSTTPFLKHSSWRRRSCGSNSSMLISAMFNSWPTSAIHLLIPIGLCISQCDCLECRAKHKHAIKWCFSVTIGSNPPSSSSSPLHFWEQIAQKAIKNRLNTPESKSNSCRYFVIVTANIVTNHKFCIVLRSLPNAFSIIPKPYFCVICNCEKLLVLSETSTRQEEIFSGWLISLMR